MNTNSECVYTVYTYSEYVVTVDSSRPAALEARNARGGTRGLRASGVLTENAAVAEILGLIRLGFGPRTAMVGRQSPKRLERGEMLRINKLQN
jgi:hypothetical protein